MFVFQLPIALFCLAVKNENMRMFIKYNIHFFKKSNSKSISTSEFERVSPWQREGDESIVDGGLYIMKFQQFFLIFSPTNSTLYYSALSYFFLCIGVS
jgi:hypothetical protein